jgi:hypothetical protein
MEQNPRDSPVMVEPELDNEEISFLERNFPKIEIDGVTYYLVSM